MNFPNQNSNEPLQSQPNPWSNAAAAPVGALSMDERLDFIRKTYSLFLSGILTTLVVGFLTLKVDALLAASFALISSPLLLLVLLLGASIGAQAVSRTLGVNVAALFGFTAFTGFWLTPLLVIYEHSFPGLVAQAAILTTLTFGALTAYAFVSRKDFSFLGGMLFVGLIALIGGGLVNIFLFKSLNFSYWMAWGTLLIFSGFVLYDTSRIMRTHDRNAYVSAALHLFLDFLNMFLALLRILSGSRR